MNSGICIEQVKKENLVLLADRAFKKYDGIDADSETLEMIPDEYFYEILDCLNSIAKSVTHYNNLTDFIDNISKHKNDIVFTIYGGSSSRNRMALVPAICEAYRIRFVGADTYARILCQDKWIAKEYCKMLGLETPSYILVNQFTDLSVLRNLKFPVVIKPNLEGSSIGIHERSLVNNYEDAVALSNEIQNKYRQPALIEEFIGGKEICVCVSGSIQEINLLERVEVYMAEDEGFFDQNLYSAFIKHISDSEIKHRMITDTESIYIEKFKNLFLSLGKMDYLRIDGKLNDGKFHLIELTPDPHLSSASSFALAFKRNGLSYRDMIATFICNALEYYQYQYSSR